jgi:hypothetical protein
MTMDGGGIKGMITSECINKIETAAYQYAKDQPYFKNVPEVYDEDGKRIERIHMQWLFDMFSGTSTGSLLSGAMAVYNTTVKPKDDLKDGFKRPAYWGSDATGIYQKSAPDIFTFNGMAVVVKFLYYLAFLVVFSVAFYLIGNRCYNRQKKIIAFERIEKFLLE